MRMRKAGNNEKVAQILFVSRNGAPRNVMGEEGCAEEDEVGSPKVKGRGRRGGEEWAFARAGGKGRDWGVEDLGEREGGGLGSCLWWAKKASRWPCFLLTAAAKG